MYNVTIEVGNGIEASFAVDMAAVKGEQGIQGVKGDTGKGFTILGTYATVEALAAAVTDAEQGDYYNVGTEAPYHIYMWDDAEGWQDQGQLQGPTGAQGEPGPSGPNMVTAETETTLTGLLKGDGTSVSAAEAGTDYVAPVEGKGLSTNDFTDAYKAKINQNATDIAAKQAKITVSGLLKGAGDGSISAAVSGTDYVAPVAGKGLSSNDYTTEEKTKLEGLSAPVARTATLTVAGWSGTTQTVSVAGVTANSILTVTYAPASHDAWLDAGVYCSAQGAGTLTFPCESVPSAALTANIVILA